jgi:YbbR domain-containing protein
VTLLVTVVVLALVVWFVIADAENQEIEARLGFSLEVEVNDLGTDLVVAGDPLPVTVTVVGREDDVESARPEHFKASLSMRNRAAGRHSLPVRVEAIEGDVRVRAVQPETAVVILQEVVEREVPVIVEPSNLPPLGFRVGAPEVVPDTAIVSGIASEVAAVDSVVARLDLGGAQVSVERNVTLEARTAAGGAVSQVVVNPRFAQVRVPVDQELFRRTASILPDVTGTPAQGYRVRAVRATPSTVDILVSAEVLDDEVEVLTEPINVGGQETNVTTQVRLVFADGAAPAGDSEITTRVLIVIEPVITTVQLPVSVETFAVRDTLELAFASPPTAQVTLRGPVALISNLEGPLSPIRVNLGSYTEGRHRIELSWIPPQGIELVELAPRQLTVRLNALPEPAPEPEQESEQPAQDNQSTLEDADSE